MSDTQQLVRIADLVQHAAFQVRERLDAATLIKYRRGFELDGPIASVPILVGRIRPPDRTPRGRPNAKLARDCPVGALVLLAGYHRVRACADAGRDTILARIVDTTAREAQWLAAESNMAHGLPLKGSELRAAFYAYLRAGQYRTLEGGQKSLRDMGRLFGKHHTTIHSWMNTPEFRWLRDKYAPEEVNKAGPIEPIVPPSPEEQTLMSITEALRIARALHPALTPDQKEALGAELEATFWAVMGAGLTIPTGGTEGADLGVANLATSGEQPGRFPL